MKNVFINFEIENGMVNLLLFSLTAEALLYYFKRFISRISPISIQFDSLFKQVLFIYAIVAIVYIFIKEAINFGKNFLSSLKLADFLLLVTPIIYIITIVSIVAEASFLQDRWNIFEQTDCSSHFERHLEYSEIARQRKAKDRAFFVSRWLWWFPSFSLRHASEYLIEFHRFHDIRFNLVELGKLSNSSSLSYIFNESSQTLLKEFISIDWRINVIYLVIVSLINLFRFLTEIINPSASGSVVNVVLTILSAAIILLIIFLSKHMHKVYMKIYIDLYLKVLQTSKEKKAIIKGKSLAASKDRRKCSLSLGRNFVRPEAVFKSACSTMRNQNNVPYNKFWQIKVAETIAITSAHNSLIEISSKTLMTNWDDSYYFEKLAYGPFSFRMLVWTQSVVYFAVSIWTAASMSMLADPGQIDTLFLFIVSSISVLFSLALIPRLLQTYAAFLGICFVLGEKNPSNRYLFQSSRKKSTSATDQNCSQIVCKGKVSDYRNSTFRDEKLLWEFCSKGKL